MTLYDALKASKGLPVSDSYAALWGKSAAESGIKTLTGRLPLYFRTSENKLRDWVIYGNNLPGKNLYYPPNDRTVNGVTFTGDLTNGTVTANGKNTGTSSGSLFYEITNYPDGDYYLSGCADGGSVTTYNIHIFDTDTSNRAVSWDETTISDRCYSMSQQVKVHLYSSHSYRITIQVASGYTVNNVVFKPMLRKADTSPDFEPYQLGVGERTKNIFKIIPSEQIITETGTLGFTVDAFVGTIAATGTSGTEASVKQRFIVSSEMAGNYYFSADFNLVGSTGTFDAYLYDLTAHRFITKWDGTTRTPTIIGTESQEVLLIEGHNVEITLRIFKETTVDELIFKPMLRPANTKSDFIPYGYQIPLDVRDGKTGEYNYAYDIFIGESPLTEGESISKSSTGIDIRTIADQENYPNILTTALTNKPEMLIKYKEYEE